MAKEKSVGNVLLNRKKRDKGWFSYILNNCQLYLMFLPGTIILLIFSYAPMAGLYMAFTEYSPRLGIFGSEFVGFDNLIYAVNSFGFWNLVKNTLILGVLKLIFCFPLSIILALLYNELKTKWYKKFVQTACYLPYFISWVIISSMLYAILNTDFGLLNSLLVKLGKDPVQWYAEPKYWRFILTFMSGWKSSGWGTITFMAALADINPDLYGAAEIDGADRWKQTIHVTIPGLMHVIGITFVLSAASIVRDDFDMIYCLTNGSSLLNEVADVLGTWSFRTFQGASSGWGGATAVGMAQGIIGLLITLGCNAVLKKTGNPSMWGD